ncbi:MAG: hypothetical protein MUO62_16345 [Anaerolineales bacterium]|nr:hypothetical protein [Anaerolineales bacterium]
MDKVLKINQAYSLTPWRKQYQLIGLFLVVLVVFGLIAGVYLNVNARAATIGRQIQNDRNRIDELENSIADHQSQLAILTSASVMEIRARAMGFREANADEIIYIVVEGYNGRQPVAIASEARTFTAASIPMLSPAFTLSLFDWVQQELSLPEVTIRRTTP